MNGKAIIILPGLIQSMLNVFVYLALPLIKKLSGQEAIIYDVSVRARLAEDLIFHRFPDFKREDGELLAYLIRGASSMLNVLVRADGYILTEPNRMIVQRDTYVNVALMVGLPSLP